MTDPARIDVVVADDHELVRAAIIMQLDAAGWIRCVGEAGTGADAIELAQTLLPDVVLVDVGLPDMSGFDVVDHIVRSDLGVRAVLVSSRMSADLVRQGFEAGAWGYLSKASSVELLVDAVQAVANGSCYVDPEASATIAPAVASMLDDAQLQVLEQLVAGRSDAAIAQVLGIDADTVRSTVASLLERLGCTTRTEAVNRAIRQGFAQ